MYVYVGVTPHPDMLPPNLMTFLGMVHPEAWRTCRGRGAIKGAGLDQVQRDEVTIPTAKAKQAICNVCTYPD